jgi:3-hydroxymyristoyl/3-hydroxydecanoyl-(acyl carrier protein) dehydratase
MSIDEANFYHHVFPGDRICIHAINESTGRAGMAGGQFYVDDVLVADCKLKFIVLDSLN